VNLGRGFHKDTLLARPASTQPLHTSVPASRYHARIRAFTSLTSAAGSDNSRPRAKSEWPSSKMSSTPRTSRGTPRRPQNQSRPQNRGGKSPGTERRSRPKRYRN
jgi:hypothetical protein